jgi:hypothetical protein
MHYQSKIRHSLRVSQNPEDLSNRLAVELPKLGLAVRGHQRGVSLTGTMLRPFSLAWGQHVRVDLRPVDRQHTAVTIEAAFPFPRIDFSHEHERTVALIEDLVEAGEPSGARDRAVA